MYSLKKSSKSTDTLFCGSDKISDYRVCLGAFMTVDGVNLERQKDVDTIEPSNECVEMLREKRCSTQELPRNRKGQKQRLNAFVSVAPYALGKVVYA